MRTIDIIVVYIVYMTVVGPVESELDLVKYPRSDKEEKKRKVRSNSFFFVLFFFFRILAKYETRDAYRKKVESSSFPPSFSHAKI